MLARHKILVNRIETYYWERNPRNSPVVLFVHGFKGEHSGLTAITTPFQGYRIIMIDLPGHGLTKPLSTQHTILNFVKFINQFCRQLGLSKIHLVGHSYGGSIALVYGGLFPDTLISLSLVMPAIPAKSISSTLADLELKINRLLPPRLQKVWLYSPPVEAAAFVVMIKTLSRKQRIAILKRKFQKTEDYDLNVLTECLTSFTRTPYFSYARKITAPTLIIGGDKDFIASKPSLHLLQKYIHNSDLKILTSTGHLANLEKPGTLATLIISFIKSSRVASLPKLTHQASQYTTVQK